MKRMWDEKQLDEKYGAGGGATLYRHDITITDFDHPFIFSFETSSPAPVTTYDELQQFIQDHGYYAGHWTKSIRIMGSVTGSGTFVLVNELIYAASTGSQTRIRYGYIYFNNATGSFYPGDGGIPSTATVVDKVTAI